MPPTSGMALGPMAASGSVVSRLGDMGGTPEEGVIGLRTAVMAEPHAKGRPFADPASFGVAARSNPSYAPTTVSVQPGVRSVEIGEANSTKEPGKVSPWSGSSLPAKSRGDVALPETAWRTEPTQPADPAAPAQAQIRPKLQGARSLKESVAVLRGVESDSSASRFESHAPVTRTEHGVPSRTEAPRFAAPQVAETLLRHPGRSVEVTLNPEELGRVRMALNSHDGAISVTITGDRIETLDLMRRHIDVLAQEFRRLGFDHVGFDFRQSGSGGQQPAQSGSSLPGPEGEPEASTPPPARRPVAVSGLDMRV